MPIVLLAASAAETSIDGVETERLVGMGAVAS
jgi:hypothetical protein